MTGRFQGIFGNDIEKYGLMMFGKQNTKEAKIIEKWLFM